MCKNFGASRDHTTWSRFWFWLCSYYGQHVCVPSPQASDVKCLLPFFSLRQEACVGGQPTTHWAFQVYVWAFPLTFSSTYTLAHSKPTSTVISETYTALNSIKPGCGPSSKFLSMNQSKTVLLLVSTNTHSWVESVIWKEEGFVQRAILTIEKTAFILLISCIVGNYTIHWCIEIKTVIHFASKDWCIKTEWVLVNNDLNLSQLIGIVHMLCCNKYSKAILE